MSCASRNTSVVVHTKPRSIVNGIAAASRMIVSPEKTIMAKHRKRNPVYSYDEEQLKEPPIMTLLINDYVRINCHELPYRRAVMPYQLIA